MGPIGTPSGDTTSFFFPSTVTVSVRWFFRGPVWAKSFAQIGFTDWFMDFPHPSDLLEPAVAGSALASQPTFNTSQVNDPVLNKKIADLVKQDPQKVASQYSDLDKYIVQDKAYLAPYGTEQSTTFMSERMDIKNCSGVHPYYKNDWLQFCLK